MTDEAGLRIADDGAVRLLTLDRPEARNALDSALRRALTRALRAAEADPEVRAVVLTGTDPAFCAGLDLREVMAAGSYVPERVNPAQQARACRTPVIAAVNGACYTGALEVALSCAFLVASERARFADTHVRIGLIAGWGGSALLPAAVGVRRARQLMLTGEPIDAATALQWGLVNEVVAHERLLPRALEIARAVAAADPHPVRTTMTLLAAGEGAPTAHALGLEAETAALFRAPLPSVGDRFGASGRQTSEEAR